MIRNYIVQIQKIYQKHIERESVKDFKYYL